MRRPIRIAIPIAMLGSATAAAVAFGATIPIYTNDMSSSGARRQLVRIGSGECQRGGAGQTLKVTVGKRSRECQLRTPVIGTNLDITVTARLLSATRAPIQGRTFVSVSLRNGDGGQYQLRVFPKRGAYELRRELPPQNSSTVLAKGKAGVIKPIGGPNKLRLQAFPAPGGQTRLIAFDNGRNLALVTEDPHTASTLTGHQSTVSVGSDTAAKGAVASFDNLTVTVPNPF
jgi:hypothetical protein